MVKVLSFDIFLFDSFTVGIFISTRGICAYMYLSTFFLSTFLLFDIFTIRHFNFRHFCLRHFNFDIFTFDVFTFDVIQVNRLTMTCSYTSIDLPVRSVKAKGLIVFDIIKNQFLLLILLEDLTKTILNDTIRDKIYARLSILK